jgi:hypothetical protein
MSDVIPEIEARLDNLELRVNTLEEASAGTQTGTPTNVAGDTTTDGTQTGTEGTIQP